MPEKPSKSRIRRKTAARFAAFFVIAAGLIGGIFLYWYKVYLPSEILTALRNGKVSGLEAPGSEVPKFLRDYFDLARPDLMDALYGDDENVALLAFVTLRNGLKGEKFKRFRENRFKAEDGNEGAYRAALLIEWEIHPGSTAGLGFPETFRSAYLRWKATIRPGPFRLIPDYRIEACRDLAKLEGAGAVPFLLAFLRDPAVTPSEKLPVAVLLAGHPEAREAYDVLMQSGLSPAFFLNSLMRRNKPWTWEIMKKAWISNDPTVRERAVEFFMRYPTPEGAELLSPLLSSADDDRTLRCRIASAFLRKGDAGSADWVWKNAATWTREDLADLFRRVTDKAFKPLHPGVVHELIARASGDGRPGVPAESLNAWISLEGSLAYSPHGFEELVIGNDPLQILEAPARGLKDRKDSFRANWSSRVLHALVAMESGGLIDALASERAGKCIQAASDFLALPPEGGGPDVGELRTRLARLAGIGLTRHRAVLTDPAGVARDLAQAARDHREDPSTRREAAFWLGLAGEDADGVARTLSDAAKSGPIEVRYACAAALGRWMERTGRPAGGDSGTGVDPRLVFEEAWNGNNPLLFFLAARETSFLPHALMDRAVKPLYDAYLKKEREWIDLHLVGKAGLVYLFCIHEDLAVDKAKWFNEDKIPGGLVTVWAGIAGVPSHPEGDVSVLTKLAAVARDTSKDPGEARAALLLLQRWTGSYFGYYPWHQDRRHAAEVGTRWRAWLTANLERLEWSAAEGRFRVR